MGFRSHCQPLAHAPAAVLDPSALVTSNRYWFARSRAELDRDPNRSFLVEQDRLWLRRLWFEGGGAGEGGEVPCWVLKDMEGIEDEDSPCNPSTQRQVEFTISCGEGFFERSLQMECRRHDTVRECESIGKALASLCKPDDGSPVENGKSVSQSIFLAAPGQTKSAVVLVQVDGRPFLFRARAGSVDQDAPSFCKGSGMRDEDCKALISHAKGVVG